MKRFIRRALSGALLLATPCLVTASCSDPAVNKVARSGTLSIALRATAASGAEYRLRDGTFNIIGPSQETVSTEDDPDAESINVQLDAGNYSVTLGSDWFLERRQDDGQFQRVEATLLSPSAQPVTIVAKQTSNIRYRFRVASDVIDVGGTLSIGIDVVEDSPSTCAAPCDEGGSCSCTNAWYEVAAVASSGDVTIDRVDAIHRLASDPSTMLVVTQNVGAACGGTIGASTFIATLDPQTGIATDVVAGATLPAIQNVSGQILETLNGTLFTGSGWCGPSAPQISRDRGLTWNSSSTESINTANALSLAQFHGRVYVGTSDEGRVYEWLETDAWREAFAAQASRSRASALRVYRDNLYVGLSYDETDQSTDACDGPQPVYVSSDGIQFEPVTGLDPCQNLSALEVIGDSLVAVMPYPGATTGELYELTPDGRRFALYAPSFFGGSFRVDATDSRFFAVADGKLVVYGEREAGEGRRLYVSDDKRIWTLLGAGPEPGLSGISFENGTLYAYGRADASGVAHVYGLSLEACEPLACKYNLVASPSPLDLGQVPLGTCQMNSPTSCVRSSITLTYMGPGSITIGGFGANDLTGSMRFFVLDTNCGDDRPLETGDSCEVVISAEPSGLGDGTGRLDIASEALGLVATVPLIGTGVPAP